MLSSSTTDVDADPGRGGLPTSLTVAIAASRTAIAGAALDLLGLLLLLGIGPNTGYSETTVSLYSWHQLGVPVLVDVLTIAGALMTGRCIGQARGSARIWGLITFGLNVSYRAVTGLVFWVAASDTGAGQPAPDYSRSWVLCGGVVVLVATALMVGSLASPSALRFLDKAKTLRDSEAGEAPRRVKKSSPAKQIALVVTVGIMSLFATGLALLILLSTPT